MDFIIVVANHGEDAYNAKFYVVLPNGIGFKVATRLDYTESKISCTSSVNASVFVCDLGNPLIKDDAVITLKLNVLFGPKSLILGSF